MGKIGIFIFDAGISFRIERPTGVISLYKSQLWLRSRILPPWSKAICLYESRRAHTYSMDGPICLLRDPSDTHLGLPAATQISGCRGCPNCCRILSQNLLRHGVDMGRHWGRLRADQGPPGAEQAPSSQSWDRPEGTVSSDVRIGA